MNLGTCDLSGRLTLAPWNSSSLTTASSPLVAATCSIVWAMAPKSWNASTCPPLRSHSATFCRSPRAADMCMQMSKGSEVSMAALGRDVLLSPDLSVSESRCRDQTRTRLPSQHASTIPSRSSGKTT